MNSTLKFLSLVIALNCPPLAFADNYSFSRVFTGQATSGVAINDNGLVAFTYAGIQGYSDQRLITTDGITTTAIAGPSSSNGDPSPTISLNNSGFVAFRGYSSNGRCGILASNGTTTYQIAADVNNGGSFWSIGSSALSINDSGIVAFTAAQDSSGYRIFAGSGGSCTLLVNNSMAGFPAINNTGTVAYEGFQPWGINIQKESQTYTLPGMPVGGCMPDINHLGSVAFSATVDGVQKVVIGDGASPTTYIDASLYSGGLTGGYSIDGGVCDCALNDQGHVAFGACVTSLGVGYGIFTGPDPATDKVIMDGDTLDGLEVTRLIFSRNGLNNSGQIAFIAQLSDGTSGVWVATPVPEPSTVVLLVVASIGLLGYCCRDRNRCNVSRAAAS
jgi:hypothetical protein